MRSSLFTKVCPLVTKIKQSILLKCCVLCIQATNHVTNLCEKCLARLPTMPKHCRRCGIFLPENGLCGKCLHKRRYYTQVVAAFPYEGLVEHMISQLKYAKRLVFARTLSQLLFEKFAACQKPEAILPVPLHGRRLISRGFNQSFEMIRPLAKHFSIPLLHHSVIRQKITKPQIGLDSKARTENLQGAFKVVKPIVYEHIVLFDDVMTTGATIKELAKTLHTHGVKQIDIWCLARRG